MMKLFSVLLALSLALTVCAAFAQEAPAGFGTLPEDVQIQYSDIVAEYVNEMTVFDPEEEKILVEEMSAEDIEELKAELALAHECGHFGYTVVDINGDGVLDLVIASDKLVLGVWSYGKAEEGEDAGELIVYPVLQSFEDVRFYYAGDGKFADVSYEDGQPVYETSCQWTAENDFPDLGEKIDPANYVQLDLIPVYPVQE